MIIELFGLPGSGKSTLARALHKQGFVLVKITSKPQLLWYNLRFCIQYPRAAFRLGVLLFKNIRPWPLAYMKCMNSFLQHNAKYMYAKKFEKAVIDQGHLQNILSLFETKRSVDDITSYIKKIPHINHTIILQVSDTTRNKRIQERGFGPREHMDETYRTNWNEVVSHNYAVAIEVLGKLPEAIFVNAEAPIQDVVSDVQSRIV